jgi:hypothetical protein
MPAEAGSSGIATNPVREHRIQRGALRPQRKIAGTDSLTVIAC